MLSNFRGKIFSVFVQKKKHMFGIQSKKILLIKSNKNDGKLQTNSLKNSFLVIDTTEQCREVLHQRENSILTQKDLSSNYGSPLRLQKVTGKGNHPTTGETTCALYNSGNPTERFEDIPLIFPSFLMPATWALLKILPKRFHSFPFEKGPLYTIRFMSGVL